MSMVDETKIKKLIQELKVNDREEVYEGREKAVEPRAAMEALIEIGKPVVPYLLKLLEESKSEETAGYYSEYVIRILGEIKDPSSIEPLIEFLPIYWSDYIPEAAEKALIKIGKPALEPLIRFARENWNDDIALLSIANILERIKDERSFNMLIEMLSHPDDDTRKYAAKCLGRYGGKRAFEPVLKVFAEDPGDPDVKEAVKALAKDPEAYRKTLETYGLVGNERIKKLRNAISSAISPLEHVDSKTFEGDEAEKLNAILWEYRIREALRTLLSEIRDWAADESVISDSVYRGLEAIERRILSDNIKLERRFKDIIKAFEWRFPEPSFGVSERSYKGLIKGSWYDQQSLLEALRDGIQEWLKDQGFKVLKRGRLLWARKRKAKECLVYLTKKEGKRIYGKVLIEPCGEGWTAEEAEAFKATFWQIVDKLVREII